MKNKLPYFLVLAALLLSLSGCDIIFDIFRAGMGVGIFLVLVVLALIVYVVIKIRGRKS